MSLAALALGRAGAALLGHAGPGALVLAILLGAALRTAWTPGPRWRPGIDLSARRLLEVAVVLLGASVGAGAVLAVGPALLAGVAAVVVLAIGTGYGLCRLLRLPPRMALLVACGTAVCGNAAIAAVAPVIGADGEDVGASIAFTAVLGVLAVLGLPLLVPLLGLSGSQYGVLAGMTVYAVPQVLAATAPVGPLSVQLGTVVKLVRVLMLGPVVLALALLVPRPAGAARGRAGRLPVPWFVLGFLGLAGLRALGLVPDALLAPVAALTAALTVVSMAALGLGVDARALARAGVRVTAAVAACLLALGLMALSLIGLLGVP